MLRSTPARVLALVLVLGALSGLLLWGGVVVGAVAESGGYPNEYALTLDYDRYVGQEVVVTARVVETDPLTVAETFDSRTGRLVVTDAEVDAGVGDRLVIFGVAEPDHTVRALNAYAVPDTGVWYAYVVSALAGLWVLARLVRGWRLDTDRWGLAPRTDTGGDRDA